MDPIYDKFFDFKVFELFRDQFFSTVNRHRKEESEEDFYRHIFLAPEELAAQRVFQIQGKATPFVCLWASSPFTWEESKYGRSVLKRDFSYQEEGVTKYCSGYLYDLKKNYTLYASSYFASFINAINADLLDFDRIRYHRMECNPILPGFSTVVEMQPQPRQVSQKTNESAGNRSFSLICNYQLSVTFPVIDKDIFIDKINLYLNEKSIYTINLSGGTNGQV